MKWRANTDPNKGILISGRPCACYICIYITLLYVCSAHLLSSQLCPTICDPIDCSPPSSSVHGISRQEYCSGLPFPPPGDLPGPGIEPGSPTIWADSLPSKPPGKPIVHFGECFGSRKTLPLSMPSGRAHIPQRNNYLKSNCTRKKKKKRGGGGDEVACNQQPVYK